MALLSPPIPNRFRQALLARERLIGCWASLSSPISTEVLGYSGFDWLLIDGEHAPNDLSSILLQLMALKDSPCARNGPSRCCSSVCSTWAYTTS
jgi:2-dehydro-3-deoxyglucarate aldolase